MFVTELDTFVRKFHQLWNDGLTAHLDLDTHAGNAWVGLRVQLGQVPGPPHQPFPQQVQRKVESPARERRRARRAAAKAENAQKTETAVEAAEVENEKETTEIVDENSPDVEVSDRDGKVSDIAEVASTDENLIEGLIDEVCSDKEYRTKAIANVNEGSIIPQVDGTFDQEVVYTFVSDFHKEDIEYTVKEVIPEDVETKLVSAIRIGGLQSADQLCTLVVKIPPDKNFIWPRMSKSQSEVIREIKTVPHFDPA